MRDQLSDILSSGAERFWALLRLFVSGDLQVVFVGSKSPFGIEPITSVLSFYRSVCDRLFSFDFLLSFRTHLIPIWVCEVLAYRKLLFRLCFSAFSFSFGLVADFDFWFYLRVRKNLFGLLSLAVGYRIRIRDNKNSLLVSTLHSCGIIIVNLICDSSRWRSGLFWCYTDRKIVYASSCDLV